MTVDGSLGTDIGLFSAYSANTLTNFITYARGNSNEFVILDSLTK